MSEFTKTKITFALALLGTLFALHPFLDRFADRGFLYLGYELKVFDVYFLTAGLLSLCVYLYAVTLLSERPHSWWERSGNYTYALAIMVVPIYGGLFLSARLADRVAVSHLAWAAPAVALGFGAGSIALSHLVAWRIRNRLGEQDRIAKMEQLAKQEAESLNRARAMFGDDHFDLSVIEACRALEARLRQVLLSRRVITPMGSPQAVIQVAIKKRILHKSSVAVLHDLVAHWAIAVSTDPVGREAALESLSSVRHILSITPVHGVESGDAAGSLEKLTVLST